MSRPTKYENKYTNDLDEYTKLSKIPYLEEFASNLGVDEDTITNWGKKHEEFFGAIKRLKTKQKFQLQKLGLSSKINSTMAIFQLKVNHGFIETEKKQIEHGGGINTNLTGSIEINERKQEAAKRIIDELLPEEGIIK